MDLFIRCNWVTSSRFCYTRQYHFFGHKSQSRMGRRRLNINPFEQCLTYNIIPLSMVASVAKAQMP